MVLRQLVRPTRRHAGMHEGHAEDPSRTWFRVMLERIRPLPPSSETRAITILFKAKLMRPSALVSRVPSCAKHVRNLEACPSRGVEGRTGFRALRRINAMGVVPGRSCVQVSP